MVEAVTQEMLRNYSQCLTLSGGLIGGAGLKPEFIDIVHCKEN